MKVLNFATCMALALAVLMPTPVAAADNGVDDFRGRWDFEWTFNDGDPQPPLILYINEMRTSLTLPNTYYAAGCMRSPDTNAIMPLSLRATHDPETSSYEFTIYSTIVPPGEYGEPFLIRFNGTASMNGESVKDDEASGTLITGFDAGEWHGVHHDRRVTKCPSIRDYGLGFDGDLYAHRDLNGDNPGYWTLYEGHTVIVSSGMLVEAPDGTQTIVQEYTDIFSPDVDFVGRFRYLLHFEGMPQMGGTYRFTLLDIFGDPIPGTESTDIWYVCNQGAPVNINGAYNLEENVLLAWDAVPDVPGEFETGGDPQIGYYQIGISPFNWPGDSDYGSAGIASPNHVIPWNTFEPGSPGSPDGTDFGIALGEFQDGVYEVGVFAFSQPNPQSAGTGHECMTYDSSEFLRMDKQGSDLNFYHVGAISGHVYDADGNPLDGIGVDTEEGGYRYCTDEDGYYTLQELPYGTSHNIVAGRDFCGEHPFEEQTQFNIAVGSTDVNFNLNMASEDQPITIIAQPDHEWIFSIGWEVDGEITMYVDDNTDPDDGYLLMMTQIAVPEPSDPTVGTVWFSDWAPFDLMPSMYVIVTDGSAAELLQVEPLSVDGFDHDATIVSGIAPPLREVGVGVHQPGGDFWMVVTSDTDGYWFADFSLQGVDPPNVFDIHAMIWDGDGDATQANYNFP